MDVNKLTMRQMREVQKVLGCSTDELSNDQFGLMAAMAWVVKKEEDKTFTFEKALDLTAEEIGAILGVDTTPLEAK